MHTIFEGTFTAMSQLHDDDTLMIHFLSKLMLLLLCERNSSISKSLNLDIEDLNGGVKNWLHFEGFTQTNNHHQQH